MHNPTSKTDATSGRSFRLWQVLSAVAILTTFAISPATADPAPTNNTPEPATTNHAPAQIVSNATNRIAIEAAHKDAVYDDIAVFTEALMLVKRQYVDEKAFRDLIYGAIDGMLVSLDPHSGFLQPQQYQELREDTSGHFSGIGIHVGIKDGCILVLAPIDGSPAQRAGLLSGDKIVKIDGQNA